MSDHLCHAMACKIPVDPSLLMCGPHWKRVPKSFQARLWRWYIPGQEIRKDPTMEYLKAAEACIHAVALKEGLIVEGGDQGALFEATDG